jgi:prolyl-tRNA editing enzyme YbaK/EbsC (Cys-tRNA(Pro) deacylase)
MTLESAMTDSASDAPTGLTGSAARVRAALDASGLPFRIRITPTTTRTAQEAAQTLGCGVAQIVKSLVFRGTRTGKPVVVLASGVNRVDERRIAEYAGEPIARGDADFVRSATGYAIGGVPPLGFPQPLETWIDEALLQHGEVWAAAGTPHAVFPLDPRQLATITGGTVVRVV